MSELLTQPFLISLLFGAVTAGVPLLLAGLGEQISEKAGVLNIGIEGMMLFGAYTGFVAAYYSGSFWMGFLAGGLGGMVVASVVVLLCIRQGLNQIVIGIALTIGAEGLTALLHFFQFSKTYPRLDKAPVLEIPGLASIPVVGPALFSHNIIVYLAVGLVVFLAWLFRASYVGLNLEAAGAKPAALDAAGISVVATRSAALQNSCSLLKCSRNAPPASSPPSARCPSHPAPPTSSPPRRRSRSICVTRATLFAALHFANFRPPPLASLGAVNSRLLGLIRRTTPPSCAHLRSPPRSPPASAPCREKTSHSPAARATTPSFFPRSRRLQCCSCAVAPASVIIPTNFLHRLISRSRLRC